MFSILKDHPFAVEAFFESSVVLAYALPKEALENRIPQCLRLDLFQDRWAFLAVAIVQTRDLRPKGFPRFIGSDFSLVGYRVFVRYRDNAGKERRGLYILRSQTDSRRMEFFGNIFTHYNYSTTGFARVESGGRTEIVAPDFRVVFEEGDENTPLPPDSPFADWKEARKYEGPLPYTFTYDAKTRKVVIIEGVRQNWKPSPVRVLDHDFAFIAEAGLHETVLANAFVIRNVPYLWEKGQTEIWQPT
jgi:hypothetical protein